MLPPPPVVPLRLLLFLLDLLGDLVDHPEDLVPLLLGLLLALGPLGPLDTLVGLLRDPATTAGRLLDQGSCLAEIPLDAGLEDLQADLLADGVDLILQRPDTARVEVAILRLEENVAGFIQALGHHQLPEDGVSFGTRISHLRCRRYSGPGDAPPVRSTPGGWCGTFTLRPARSLVPHRDGAGPRRTVDAPGGGRDIEGAADPDGDGLAASNQSAGRRVLGLDHERLVGARGGAAGDECRDQPGALDGRARSGRGQAVHRGHPDGAGRAVDEQGDHPVVGSLLSRRRRLRLDAVCQVHRRRRAAALGCGPQSGVRQDPLRLGQWPADHVGNRAP